MNVESHGTDQKIWLNQFRRFRLGQLEWHPKYGSMPNETNIGDALGLGSPHLCNTGHHWTKGFVRLWPGVSDPASTRPCIPGKKPSSSSYANHQSMDQGCLRPLIYGCLVVTASNHTPRTDATVRIIFQGWKS